jgi:MFS family permease
MRKRTLSPFVLLCVVGGLAIFSSTMAKNPALPLFIRSLGVPPDTLGFIAAASTVVGILVSIPAGILSDVIGRRKVLLISLAVFATAPFFYLLVRDPWHLVMVRVYHGLATAILGPVAMAAVADLYDARRGERMAWYSSATMIGRFLAPTVGGLLIFGDNYRWVYLADGVVGVMALLVAFQLPRLNAAAEARATEARATEAGAQMRQSWRAVRRDLGVLVRNTRLLGTSLVEATQYFAFGFVEVYLPIYLHEHVGLTPWQIGPLFTGQIVVAAVVKPFSGRLSDRVGRVPMIVAGMLLCSASMATMPIVRSYALLMLAIACFGLGLATVTASTSAFAADLSTATTHGAALGTLSSIMDVGHSAGPMVGGLLVVAVGYQVAFHYVAAGIATVALLYAWRIGVRRQAVPRPGV